VEVGRIVLLELNYGWLQVGVYVVPSQLFLQCFYLSLIIIVEHFLLNLSLLLIYFNFDVALGYEG
jgi:hypothetical protein